MSTDLAHLIEPVTRHLLGEPNKALSSKTELRFGSKGSLAVALDKGTWYDHETETGGGVLDLIRRELPDEQPMEWLKKEGFIEAEAEAEDAERQSTRKITFNYRDERGAVMYQEVRIEQADSGKRVRSFLRRPDGRGGWITGKGALAGVERLLYRLPELIDTTPGALVYVVEGPKKVDVLVGWGLAATCCTSGAGKWRSEYSDYLRDRDVVVLPDNDPQAKNKKTGALLFHPDGRPRLPGQDHAEDVARQLHGVARSVKVIMLTGLPQKGDVIDWRDAGHTREELEQLVAGSPPWLPPADELTEDGELPPEFSEAALANKMATKHAADLRYVSEWGKFYMWSKTHWRYDDREQSFNLSRIVCTAVAASITNQSLARSVASGKTRAAVLTMARQDPRIAASVDQWDADPWLLGTPGGVVDLRSGELRPARPDDHMTKTTSVAPDPLCPTPTWDAFLAKILEQDTELINYVQRSCGYMLTGSIVEHAMFFLYGLGGNGKSKFLGAIAGILGDYHTAATIETFTETPGDRHPTEMAKLCGARLVTAVETQEGRWWNESRITSSTGGDKISARFMRQDFFDFTPQFKLMIVGNHKPGLKTVNQAMRRRLQMWPFNYHVTEDERDEYLGEKLKREWPGILAWMIEGCLAWQREKLHPPKSVIEMTDEYLNQENTIRQWLDDCCDCTVDKNIFTPSKRLYESFESWAKGRGEWVGSLRKFVQRLESEGFRRTRPRRIGEKDTRGFGGVIIRTDETGPETGNPLPF